MEKPNYYAVLSAEVRYDNRLRPNVKLMYAEITALCGMNAECFASNKYFADLYGKSKTSISGWISELVKHGYISLRFTYKDGSKEINNRYIKILKGGINNKTNNPYKKTVKSNTINTNTNLTDSNKRENFKKPKLNEVKDYCILRKNNIDAEAFIAFYESKGWMVGSNKMKNWKQAIITWEKRDQKKPQTMSKIDSQLNEYLKGKEYL
jgi:hypothetical protein